MIGRVDGGHGEGESGRPGQEARCHQVSRREARELWVEIAGRGLNGHQRSMTNSKFLSQRERRSKETDSALEGGARCCGSQTNAGRSLTPSGSQFV
jgi:hypothetical protein